MRDLIFRILRRSIPVAIALAFFGYLLGEALIMYARMQNVQVATIQSVRWRAPLMMAAFGVTLLAVLECLAFAIRPKKPAHPVDPDTEPKSIGPAK